VPNVAVIVGDTKVEVIDPNVSLHVEIVEKKATQNVKTPGTTAAPLIAAIKPHLPTIWMPELK
jgi:hypothetical protein